MGWKPCAGLYTACNMNHLNLISKKLVTLSLCRHDLREEICKATCESPVSRTPQTTISGRNPTFLYYCLGTVDYICV